MPMDSARFREILREHEGREVDLDGLYEKMPETFAPRVVERAGEIEMRSDIHGVEFGWRLPVVEGDSLDRARVKFSLRAGLWHALQMAACLYRRAEMAAA